jgi:hypothetical protein
MSTCEFFRILASWHSGAEVDILRPAMPPATGSLRALSLLSEFPADWVDWQLRNVNPG